MRTSWPWSRVVGACVLSWAWSTAVSAQPSARAEELDRLRQELAALRSEYAARLASLEERLEALGAPPVSPVAEAAPAVAPPPAPGTAEVPAGAAGAGGPSGPLPVYGGASASSKIFNPDIAVIGNFLGAAGSNAVDGGPSLQFDEAEASFQAVVDPYARADFFLAFNPEGVEVEEGFLTFPTLPGGLLMKVGKLKAGFGKVNTLHVHALPWTDKPLIMRNLMGGDEGTADSGISLSRLFPNALVFLEATAEVYRGESELFRAPRRQDLTYGGRLRAYRDVTESTNLDLGGSFLQGTNDNGEGFHTRLIGADLTFRYRPLRRAIYRRLLARSELVWSRREQSTDVQSAFGAYVSADYQFARRFWAGARWDYAERADAPDLRDKGGSLLLTFWPSEFSQVRTQFRRTRYAEGETANEFLFQFLFSIGAHGAHTF